MRTTKFSRQMPLGLNSRGDFFANILIRDFGISKIDSKARESSLLFDTDSLYRSRALYIVLNANKTWNENTVAHLYS